MILTYNGVVENHLEREPDTSVTVFRKTDEGWEKLADPLYSPKKSQLPLMETWRKTRRLCIALNTPIGTRKCKVANVKNGSIGEIKQVGDFTWEIELVSDFESWQDPTDMHFEIAIQGERDGANR